MKRAVGIFFIIQSLLIYLIMNALYAPFRVEEAITNLNTGVTRIYYNLPFWCSVSYVIPIGSFILGIYFILARIKQREEKTQHFMTEG